MSAENSIGDHAPNFTHEDNRVQQSRMRWRTKNDKFSGSRRIGRYVDSLGASYSRRCASCARTTLSLSFLYTLSIPLFCTLYTRLRVNREFHRGSTIGPHSTPAIFLLFLVCDFYVHMWHTFQVYMYINEFTRLTVISRYSLILVFPWTLGNQREFFTKQA